MTNYRLCSQCRNTMPTYGGVELKPGRWYCAKCWVNYANKGK